MSRCGIKYGKKFTSLRNFVRFRKKNTTETKNAIKTNTTISSLKLALLANDIRC